MIRTHLVKALYEKMLGPELGPNEIAEFPFTKYVTGILSTTFIPPPPANGENNTPEDPGAKNDPAFTSDKVFVRKKFEDSDQSEEIVETFQETALDPRTGSKSMGVSFVISSSETPKISVCCTWARYELQSEYDRYDHGLFQRYPNFYINNEITIDGVDKKISLPVGNTPTQAITRAGVILHIRQRKNPYRKNSWTISIFLENSTTFSPEDDEREREEHRIFQPQIRINCLDGTQTEPFEYGVIPEKNSPQAKDMLAFRNRTSKARGHQCGSIWKDVDPEKELDGFGKFTWIDSTQDKFPEDAKEYFTRPDIRTDYFPSYTILQPDLSDKPEFEAEKLAEMWNPDDLRNDTINGLERIPRNYEKWIKDQYKNLEELNLEKELDDTAKTNLKLCDASLERIEKGIDLICTDTKVRLAFCFMNKVMATRTRWDRPNNPLKWREFQMAFILQSLTGLTGVDKKDAEKCDVLWFPTGGGKTEAYLGLSMFILAFRRLSDDQEFENDGGVTIVSRYTLRLLTIQQFTRSSGSILAADILRIQNWRPKEITTFDNEFLDNRYEDGVLWGNSRISIGLWIGGGISPNKFQIYKNWKGAWTPNAEGALAPHKLKDPTRTNASSGEPAQLAICPCCKNILATTSMKKNETKTLIWLINKYSKSIDLLNKLTDKDLSSENYQIKIENLSFSIPEFTSTSSNEYKLLKAEITIHGDDIDQKINRWWDDIVEKQISLSDERALESTSASRPGYFFLYFNSEIYDYSIHCTNSECFLNKPGTKWFENKITNSFSSIAEPFSDLEDPHHSSSIPISAFTVDTQVYAKCPTFLLSTADKFARIPFMHQASSIFGNVDTFHNIFGYGRDQNGTVTRKQIFRTPIDTDKKQLTLDSKDFTAVKPFNPPNLIIQDELHLIEGPLGSMVGIYEMVVDILCSNQNQKPKYIASSATIKEAESQVAAIYRRDINVFPQPGIESNDTYFSQLEEDVSSIKEKSGRLYLGICAGIGTYIIPVKIWAVLLSEVFRIRSDARNPKYGLVTDFENQNSITDFQEFVDKKIDLYWTLVGFFSDLELLARTSNFYNQDIYRDVRQFSPTIMENISTRGIGSGKKKSIKFYPFTVPRTFTASYLSVLCQSDKGKISVAIYDEKDKKPNQIIKHAKDDERVTECNKGENIFELDGNLELQEKQKIWFAIMMDSDDCFFQTDTKPSKCYESSSFVQIEENGEQVDDLGNFSSATSNLIETEELPIRIFLKSEHRELDATRRIEMSSRTDSTELPGILDQLGNTKNNQVDALLTSPIFGTGIDITRLGMMVVMNQPKTTSQYIQATGRVGRNDPGLVVSLLRMGRHRDLNHYENFVGYHRAIHKYVEPITASPFSEKTMEQYLGPVIVGALRVGRQLDGKTIPTEWVPTNNGSFIIDNDMNDEITALHKLMESITCWEKIPKIRRLNKERFYAYFNQAINQWNKAAKYAKKDKSVLAYYDYSYMHSETVKEDVVLGSPRHKLQKKHIAYENAKTSLREVESTSGIGEQLI
ncbi:MAG: hypothetical protein CL763_10030 [Chloroflexi bacterium]|nr:hypothetical protein [Chloroflexota bacterium]